MDVISSLFGARSHHHCPVGSNHVVTSQHSRSSSTSSCASSSSSFAMKVDLLHVMPRASHACQPLRRCLRVAYAAWRLGSSAPRPSSRRSRPSRSWRTAPTTATLLKSCSLDSGCELRPVLLWSSASVQFHLVFWPCLLTRPVARGRVGTAELELTPARATQERGQLLAAENPHPVPRCRQIGPLGQSRHRS